VEAAGVPPRFFNQKLYQNCTKKAAFWAFLHFYKQLKTSKLFNLNSLKTASTPAAYNKGLPATAGLFL